MAQIQLLSDSTRAARRPPRYVPPVSADLLARLQLIRLPPKPLRTTFKPGTRATSYPQQPRQMPLPHSANNLRTNPLFRWQPPVSGLRPGLPKKAETGQANHASRKSGAAQNKPPENRNGTSKALPPASPDREAASPVSETPHPSSAEPDRPAVNQNGAGAVKPDSPAVNGKKDPLTPENPLNRLAGKNGSGIHIPMEVSSRIPPVPPSGPLRPGSPHRQGGTQGLEGLLSKHPELPDQAAILGVGEDGLPVLLDLADSAPGAVLVIGDEREEQLEMLRTSLTSLAMRNSPRGVQFLVFSHQPDVWRTWISTRGYDRHTLAVEGVGDEPVREWVLRLADWTEQRRLGQRSGPPVVLVMDTLSFLQRIDYDVRLNFEWMVKEGPPAQIWPIAAVSTDLASTLGNRMLRSFQTRILGFARDPQVYARLMEVADQDLTCFTEPGRFAVSVGEGWLRFRLPGRS